MLKPMPAPLLPSASEDIDLARAGDPRAKARVHKQAQRVRQRELQRAAIIEERRVELREKAEHPSVLAAPSIAVTHTTRERKRSA